MAFQKGKSGNPAGRKPGVPNKATQDIKDKCRAFLEDPVALENQRRLYQRGKLDTALVVLYHHYAYGKPKDTIAHENAAPVLMVVDELSPEDIAELRAERTRE